MENNAKFVATEILNQLDIAQTARIQEGRPALVGCEQTFQRAGSKTGQHEDGLNPGIL
ncbi:hypothetical protein L6X12_RS24860 [Escherichia coli]|nr:hypothetical protein [Escherichia coli]MCZ6099932.1 hypothetical protein [Escherichia coli]MCZ6264919.1 hypothetical protein [Escherichia coli]